MDKATFQPLSGFRDLRGPAKDRLIEALRQIFQSFGFEALETPALERQELLLTKYGDEAQKQLYLFEDNGKRPVGLRFDLTVPLARFVAANYADLTLPFKRFEIGPSWRAERPQKGRYRQFTQADIDIVGTDSVSAEQELLEVITAFQKATELPLVVQLNDRRIVGAMLEKMAIRESKKLLQLLDKKDKLPAEKMTTDLGSLGLSDHQRRQVTSIFLNDGDSLETVEHFLGSTPELTQLQNLLTAANKIGLTAVFVPSMVRGLDYYTGTIIECVVKDSPVGAVIAGGRYDSLVADFIGQKLPAIGISFGVDRLLAAMETPEVTAPADIFLVHLPENSAEVQEFARQLRSNGHMVELYLDPTVEMGKQIKYAAKKGYASIYLPLEAEWSKGLLVRRDLDTGRQTELKHDDFLKMKTDG